MRQALILIAAYIDDLISADPSLERSVSNVKSIIGILTDLGFFINVEKSIFIPCQIMEFLGFVLNSLEMSISLTTEKSTKLVLLCDQVLRDPSLTIRQVSRLLGKMTSSMLAVRFSKMHYRNLECCKLQALKSSKGNYDAKIHLDPLAQEDITWWQENVMHSKCSFAVSNPTCWMSSDACDYGWGAVFGDSATGGVFSEEEAALHINVKELQACDFGLQSLCGDVSDCHLKVLMDNTTAVQSLNKMGSMRCVELDELSKKAWEWAIDKRILLSASHIPGIYNEEADEESRRGEQSSEWMLNS